MITINEETNRFALLDNGREIGEMTWYIDNADRIVYNHTYVNPAYRGQRLGERLVSAGVEKARQENRKIIPACSYVQALFERSPKYHDVWAK